GLAIEVSAQKTIYVRPVETDEVLTNPGIGFMTFQRFNGDKLNKGSGWTEGFPIDYQEFDGDLTNKDHPATTIAYWRIYWRFMEPEQGKYRWDMLDMALKTARSRGQTLLLRIAPDGTGDERDVPDWYREKVGSNKNWKYRNPVNKWVVDPEDPRYVEYFGGFIRAMGDRYDGHPDLEAVDLSIVGAWGEGAGSELLSQHTREALVDSYTDVFRKTPLIALLMDKETNMYANAQIPVGWRVDCIGDLGFWADEQNGWTHMYDFYPQAIIDYEVKDDWKTSPLSFEICGTFRRWKEKEDYDRDDVRYIFNETLKWHISSFNAKSSPVPGEWKDLVDDWLRKMGYRFVLKRFSYKDEVRKNENLHFKSWWENKGVAPCYKDFALAIRLKSLESVYVLPTDANIKNWLPGDNLYDSSVHIPNDLPTGAYDVQLAIVDRLKFEPRVKLAIEGRGKDGWYQLGQINITE
ncbi:MAG: DUF4832 domain-containing protein, partial [Bacteroidales bacterium]|nr:DUF4832 domain-containing protein [Bacteroidales bacterium]